VSKAVASSCLFDTKLQKVGHYHLKQKAPQQIAYLKQHAKPHCLQWECLSMMYCLQLYLPRLKNLIMQIPVQEKVMVMLGQYGWDLIKIREVEHLFATIRTTPTWCTAVGATSTSLTSDFHIGSAFRLHEIPEIP
jgi:hypothetical protein